MGLYILLIFSFFWASLFSQSRPDILAGNRITLSIPTSYEAGFDGRTVFLKTRDKVPNFRASLGVEAVDGNYVCSLSVLLGDLEVWSSKQFTEFLLRGSCVAELTRDGVFLLRDSTGRIGWRTATLGESVERVKLLRTGNLVLTDARNQIKWQSFDFPGNVMLWKQRLPVPAQLTWVSANSSLSFSFTIQSDKIALYLNSASRRYSYWEYQTHKQRNISYSLLGSTGLKLFDRGQRKMAQILVDRRMPIRFLALGKEGNLGLYHYSPRRGKFETSFRAVNATCDLPLACGRYGLCTFSNTCRCLQFTHRSNSLSSNCDEGLRNIGFCETEEPLRMVELVGISSVLEGTPQEDNVTKEECSRLCMKECWCAAALFSENGNGGTRRGCFLYELVVGLKQVDRRHQSSFLIKVPDRIVEEKSGISSRTKKWLLVSGTVVDVVVILLILAGFFWYFVLRKKKRETER